MGVNMEFSWHFTDNSHTHQSAGDCNDCLTSTVNHTFEKQGTYKIIVNASNIYNWIQKAISVAVVPQTLSTLTFSSRSGYLVELGHNVTLEVEFFTTVRQFLFLNATFQTGVTHTHQLGDHSPAFSTLGHMQLAESYGLHNCLLHVQMIHCYSTVGNFNVSLAVFSQTAAEHASLPQFIQVYEPIRNVLPSLQWEAVIPTGVNSTLTVIAPKDRSGSAVIWNITKGNLTVLNRTTWDWSLTLSLQDEGHYRLWVTAFNPISSASFSTELVAQDVISGLSVSCPYPKYIKSGTTITINATVATGSNVSYYWSLGTNSTLVTDSGTAMHLYSQAGVNIVTVKAENSVSCILSKALEFIVQDPVGDFVLRIPSIVTVNHTTVFSFAVMSGTNMSVAVFSNQTLVYNDSSYMTGNSVLLNFTFSEVGPVHIVVRATNHVFSSNSTVGALVVKEIDMVTLELPQQPVVGESIMLIAHVNGYLWTHSNYLYNWTLPQNQTFCTGSPIISFTSHYPGPLLVSVMVTNFASSASAELRLSVSEMSTSPSVLHRSAIAVGTQAQFLLKFFMEVSEPAQLSIEVTVENEVSQLSRNVSTSIQFPIADVSLTATRAALGQSTDVALTVVPAQGYVLSLNFGDGESLLSSSLEQPPSWINCSSAPLCSSTFSFSHTFSSTGVYNLSATVSNTLSSVTKSAEAAVEEPITCIQMALTSPTVIKIHDFINASASVHSGSEITFQWQISSPISGTYSAVDRNTGISSVSYKPSLPDDYIVSVRVSSPLYSSPFMRTLSSPVKVRGPVEAINVDLPFGVNYAKITPQPNGAYATEALVFRVHNVSEEVSFKFDFGDGSPLSCNKGNTGFGAATSCYHQFTKEGTFFITVTTYNEFFNATKELGPYYVEIMPENLTLTMDSSVVNKNEVIVFKALLIRGTNVTYTWNMGDQTTYVDKGPKVSHRFLTAATYSVSVSVQNRVGSVSASTSVSVLHRMQPVFIHTDETVFATNTNITFIAMTAEPDPLEFLWHFGDKPPKKTTSRNILKIYYSPGRYNVIVNASNRFSSFTSDIYPITIQRKVQPNRLLSNASVLLNANVTFQCWINAGTNVTYQWDFGDGNKRIGESSESHVFSRLGEFTVEVTVFNLVSSVSLTRQIFVVHEPCQPPPVKNMGPLKIQVRRYQTLHLGVTFEADIQCNISQGLLYQWVFYDSNGFQAQLPQIEVNQQAIELPNNLLHYGTYTAIARVQIKGSVVYSNYTVRIQVVPTPPVAVISGGSNIFISNRNGSFLTLNGQGSYDLDFPGNPMRFKWDCKPLSRIETSCFDVSIPTSIPVVVLPASILKDRFDQFKFTLTVQSRDRSSTSEMFVTIEQNLPRKILVFCYHCRGNTANWNEQFSVRALCENFSDIENITFTWNLYLVNASSKVVFEGISSDIISFMPFTLKANNLYMLEVSASSQHNLWGKTQFFFSTNEVPQGMTCQVQPSKGYEIRTDFSVFCTSGKEDLLYVYSFSTANSSRKTLYRGRDFQYFFNLPSGEPADNYKVTIYIEIHNRFGSATQPCPVNVTVLPSFLRSNSSAYSPEQELYVDGLRNLTTLMHMGNSVTTRNYVTLLTSVLNRLALDPAASKELQTQTRSALISAVCELSVNKRVLYLSCRICYIPSLYSPCSVSLWNAALMLDNISMLKALMRVTSQVTFDSAKLVTGHVQKLAAQFSRPDTAAIYVLDEWTVSSLLSLLSNALEARLPASEEGIQLTLQGIRASSDLLLSYVLMNNVTEYSVSTSLMALKISRQCRFQGAVSSSGSTTFYLPPTLGQHSSRHSSSSSTDRTCFISRLMFFRRDPYFWATAPVKINGDIADLTLFNCTTKKEIKAHALSTPVTVEFDKRWGNESGSPQFYLLRNEINIHQFSIKPENLQEALQISVDFIRPDNHTFPIMLLFRMFEKPTPSSYNVKKIHRWEGNTVHIFMSSSSLKDPGNYYLALLNANYNRAPSNKYITHAVNYTLRIEGTRCLYWDGIKDWKSDGCVPLQGLSSSKVNCSCNHLRTFTVAYQEIRSEYNCTDVSQFISAFDNLVLCSVILISLGACSLLAVVCKRADMANEKKGSLVLLQDNSPSDQQMYTVTIDTGFRSRSIMTAKVHIVLYGEEGVSETRELNCSEKVLFERNSRHTFILSSFDSLGPIWKVHLWHNNAGHSPSWYVSHVIVKDLGTGTSWFFPAECWLAVDEGDGKVERELTSLTQGPGFKKVCLLYIKLTEYLEDFHSWASVYSRPSHSRFTHTQRLTLCLLLLSGYMLLNTLLIHFRDDQYTAEFGLIDVSAVSLANGFLSTLAVLPVGALLSLLFRFSQVPTDQDATAAQTQTRRVSDVYSVEAHRDALLAENSVFESYLSWHNLQQWAQEAWRKKYERGLVEGHSPSLVSVLYGGPNNKNPGQCGSDFSSSGFEDCSLQDGKLQAKDFKHSHSDLQSSFSSEQGCVFEKQASGGSKVVLPSWCRYVAWTLCLSLSVTCIVLSAILGVKFSNTKSLLWIQSFFFSLFFCIFVVQPFMIFIAAAVVSMLFKGSCDFYKGTTETGPAFEVKHLNSKGVSLTTNYLHSPFHHPQDGHTHFDRILAARQRARYLRLARPPTSAQLRQVRDRVRKETLKQKTLRELVLYITMLFLLLFVTYGKFSSNHYHLNQAVRKEFTRSPNNPFSGVKTYEDWWNWSLTTLLDGLYWDTWYNRASAESKAGAVHGTCILIGEPTLKKIHVTNRTVCKIHSLFADLVPDCLPTYSPVDRGPGQSEGTASLALGDGPQHCGRIACYTGQGTRVNLGRARSSASVKLQELKASGWLDRDTRAVMVEFTLYNPPSNLFTSVSLLAEMPITGGLLPSVSIESVRVYHILCVLDYCIMGFELLFLAFILVQNYFQVYAMTQKGLLMYWQDPCNWLEVSIIVISLLYYIYYLYGFILTVEVIDRLQRDNFKAFVDLSFLSSWEQLTRCLHGVIVFLLLVKCIFVLRMNKVMAPSVTGLRLSLSTIMWPVVAGIIFMTAYACLGNLVFLSTSRSFSTIVRSFQTVFTHCMGASKLQTLSSLNRIHHASISVYYGTLFVIMTITWTALIIGILTSLARAAKKSSKRKYLVTFSDVMAYIRDRALVFIGRKRHRWIDNSIQRSYFYLDEFENLVDELLFRLNAFSNSLHHTLPNKEQNYHEQESLLTSQSDYDCSLDSEHTAVSEDCVKKKASKIEMLLLKKNPDVYNLILPIEEKSPDQNVLSSKLELETLRHFQMNLNCSPQIAGLEDGHFQPTAQLQKDLSKVNAGVKAIDADSADPSCSSVSDCHSSPIIPDHYNLAKLGDDLPHILCGTRCLDKQVAQGKTLGSQVSNRQSSTSASLSTKSRKVLKRSHTTIIQPWDNPTEVADRRAGNKIYSETKIPANPSLKSRTKDKGPKGPNGDMMGMKKQKQKSKHYVMIAMDNADSEVKGDFPGSPGAVRQCW
ncbi:polycystin-1-like protein 1 [Amia ocellicauda]|uniref:polycystin-1-like protein 1 n=1 Tax=Amia ocellicauda TaxID=2972642 RepID=UPI00346447B1